MADFLVRRDDPRAFRVDPGEETQADVPEGSVQFEIERFGLTRSGTVSTATGRCRAG